MPAHTAISPDGRLLAFVGSDSSGDRLWVRPLASGDARPLSDTEGAALPFWSPDSRSIGFFAAGKLKTTRVNGGTPRVLAEAAEGHGGTWSRSGVILFSPGAESPILRVNEGGGAVVPVTRLDAEEDGHGATEAKEEEGGRMGHRFPCFLPDGTHFLYLEFPGDEGLYETYLGSIDSGESKLVLKAHSVAIYGPPGYLLYSVGRKLVAGKWDLQNLEAAGDLATIDEALPEEARDGEPAVSASSNGIVAYSTAVWSARLEWFDRNGRSLGPVPMIPGPYEQAVLSPDARKALLVRYVSPHDADIWMADLSTGICSIFAREKGLTRAPAWSPDGARVAYESDRDGSWRIYARAVDGRGGEQLLYTSPEPFENHLEWSRDGRTIVSTPARTADLPKDVLSNDVTADGERQLRLVAPEGTRPRHRIIFDWSAGLGR